MILSIKNNKISCCKKCFFTILLKIIFSLIRMFCKFSKLLDTKFMVIMINLFL